MAATMSGHAVVVVAGLLACLAVGSLAVLRRHVLIALVRGASMEPTLRHGDRVLVRRVPFARLSVGDIAVLSQPSRTGSGHGFLIKRIAALPHDPVPALVRDGCPIELGPVVPEGALVLLGDNLLGSHDSRQVGFYPAKRTVGVATRVIGHALPGRATRRQGKPARRGVVH